MGHLLESPYFLGPPSSIVPGRRTRRLGNPVTEWSDELAVMILSSANIKQLPEGISEADGRSAVQSVVRRRIRSLERRLNGVPWRDLLDPHVRSSVAAMARLLRLEEPEELCLAFLLILSSNVRLNKASLILGGTLDDREATDVVRAAVGLPITVVQEILSVRGRIMGAQLIKWDHNAQHLAGKFDWISHAFRQEMLQPGFDPLTALRDRVVAAPPPTLAWEQFAHVGELRDVALSYVRQAIAAGTKGVNLLLYGDPGTGKTEFGRAFAKELGCAIFEVSSQDEEGDAIDGSRRLRALRLVHGFTTERRTILAFDEIEDVFPRPHPFFGAQAPRCKGWINRILENNPTVTLWITNAVEALDPAFVRRFDLILEVKGPPAALREAELRSLPIALSEDAVHRLASSVDLSPAVVSRAAKVVNAIQSEIPDGRAPHVMEMIVNQTLEAQGHQPMRTPAGSDSVYDPGFINSDLDPVALAEGIRRAKSARLCLYGPPGTGKTAFGSWLARRLDMPILVKRASDLLSKYLGEAEKNFAKAFREARDSRSVLLIDEVDSFLQDRSKAHRPWEVSQVNEFLTQMEQFDGVFIATTNLMEGLDQASLRRFDLKARFGYLRTGQARCLLEAHLKAAGIVLPASPAFGRLESMDTLTPGDFAAVARQHRFSPMRTAAEWIDALEGECARKPAFHRHIAGFGSARTE
jgi:AAA+ superfamily predicted ATPase